MTSRIRTLPHLAALAVVLFLAAPLRAQDVASAPVPAAAASATTDSVASPTSAGPTVNAAAVAVRRNPAEVPAPTPFEPKGGYGQSVAFMVVGGAAVVTGLVIGGGAGYAISVGGAVVGLIGLYQYLQ